MRLALELWTADANEAVAMAVAAEAAGLDAVYLGESPHGLNAETWVTLGAMANATTTLRLGPVIANLLPGYRSDLAIARQVSTLAQLSAGRLDFRTGIGAAARYGRAWWQPYGVAYPGYRERAEQLTASLERLTAWWDGRAVAAAGGAAVELGLRHPSIPVTVAASSATALDLARRFADRWETSFCTIDEWRSRVEAAPAALANSLEIDAFIAPDARRLDGVLERVRRERTKDDLGPVLERALIGTPDEIGDQIAAWADAGADQLLLALHDPTDRDAIAALAAVTRR